MSIDARTRRYKDKRELSVEEIFDDVFPTAIDAHGDLTASGLAGQQLRSLRITSGDTAATLTGADGAVALSTSDADVEVEIDPEALSDFVQDAHTAMSLAMTSKLKVTKGSLDDWLYWEPAMRALLDGREMYTPGSIEMLDDDGDPLDLDQTFTLDDDPAVVGRFLEQAGFLHLRGVFDPAEMAAVSSDLDDALAAARPDDAESWWAETSGGEDLAVRVLWFNEKSEALQSLIDDERIGWLMGLTGDTFVEEGRKAEGLVKPLEIVKGLSDLPWHKDCGQGHHSYMCSGMTVGISVTGADRVSGALGVIPGSHRANVVSTMRDRHLALAPRMLETQTGDLTVHCSDTLHRAHPPIERPRKVVYTGLRLAPLPDDEVPVASADAVRAQRAGLTDVTDRIEAADNQSDTGRYRARQG